jgi:3-hydroxyisobutyrate dehydrogenase-like beta-hydroxyacid dehydrogenase
VAELGWIGLGDIGTQMALRLVAAGHRLHAWGRTAARLQPLLDRGARAHGSAADVAAASEAVFLCVTDGDAVEQVLLGERGVAAGARSGLLVVDHSTIDPEHARRLSADLNARGLAFLDAPVSGGAPGARAGTLSIFLGGEAAAVERARPFLSAYGQNLAHLGPSGSGQLAKSCNQAIFGTTMAAWAEVIAYARAVGLDVPRLVAAMEGSWSDSPVRKHLVPHMIRARQGGSTALIEKDLTIVADTARAHGVAMPLVTDALRELKKR